MTLADRNKGKTGKNPIKTGKSRRKSLIANQCDICSNEINDSSAKCPIDSCPAMFHMTRDTHISSAQTDAVGTFCSYKAPLGGDISILSTSITWYPFYLFIPRYDLSC